MIHVHAGELSGNEERVDPLLDAKGSRLAAFAAPITGLESQPVTPETEIRLGTSAFTAAGWETAFYPPGMKPSEYLSYYATQFDTVEVDSTFYRTPSI